MSSNLVRLTGLAWWESSYPGVCKTSQAGATPVQASRCRLKVLTMVAESEQHIRTVSERVQAVRTFALILSAPFFRRTLIQPEHGLSRPQELAEQGYGNLFLFSHFSSSDIPIAFATVFENPQLRQREVLIPAALHQYYSWYKPVGRLTGIEVCPIVTDDTEQYVKEHPLKEAKFKEALTREGFATYLTTYINRALDILDNGGIVIMFPQGGRRPSLDSITPAVQMLITRSNRAKIDRFAITFIGLGIKGEQDYQRKDIKGYNLFKTYEERVGRTLTKGELKATTEEFGKSIDDIVGEELRAIVPTSYLPKD